MSDPKNAQAAFFTQSYIVWYVVRIELEQFPHVSGCPLIKKIPDWSTKLGAINLASASSIKYMFLHVK